MRFRVWATSLNETERSDHHYGAVDASEAARQHAELSLRNLGSDYWPVTMTVLSIESGNTYKVEVDRVVRYEFTVINAQAYVDDGGQ